MHGSSVSLSRESSFIRLFHAEVTDLNQGVWMYIYIYMDNLLNK